MCGEVVHCAVLERRPNSSVFKIHVLRVSDPEGLEPFHYVDYVALVLVKEVAPVRYKSELIGSHDAKSCVFALQLGTLAGFIGY